MFPVFFRFISFINNVKKKCDLKDAAGMISSKRESEQQAENCYRWTSVQHPHHGMQDSIDKTLNKPMEVLEAVCLWQPLTVHGLTYKSVS